MDESALNDPPASVPAVYAAILAVQADIGATGVAKGRRNQQQGYNFRGIDEMYNALSPLLSRHGLIILPRMTQREVEERASRNGGALFYVTVTAEFDFVAASDASRHVVRMFGEAMDSADKATNKAMSAAYKYAVMQTFAIPTEGDNDADATTHEVAGRAPVRKPEPEPVADPAQREAELLAAADESMAHYNAGDEALAWESIAGIMDNDERLYVWAYLKNQKGLRALIQKHWDAQKQPVGARS